jgi:hypothetical protein
METERLDVPVAGGHHLDGSIYLLPGGFRRRMALMLGQSLPALPAQHRS